MIGDSLLFAPVTDSKGWVEVWFPGGRWEHFQSHEIIGGPCVRRWKADLSEIPLFVREGHTLP
jgi:alpha-glucosidase (family GH31 glycosyl hydrolase)